MFILHIKLGGGWSEGYWLHEEWEGLVNQLTVENFLGMGYIKGAG